MLFPLKISGLLPDKPESRQEALEGSAIRWEASKGMNTPLVVRWRLVFEECESMSIRYKRTYEATLFLAFLLIFLSTGSIAQDGAKGDSTETDSVEKGKAFLVVEKDPKFPGGEEAMKEFITERVEYPQEAREKEIEGTVIVGFVVEKDGRLTDIEVLKKVHPSLNQEAVEVVERMPKWEPGRQKGRNVRVHMKVPVRFELENDGCCLGIF